MQYKNISDQRKLVNIGGKRVWVQPGGVVDLNTNEVRSLGVNAVSIVSKEKLDADVAEERRKRLARKFAYRDKKRRILAERAAEAERAKKKSPKKPDEKPVKKPAKPAKKVVKKVVKKAAKKPPDAAELRAQRAELKRALEEKNKVSLIEFGEYVTKIDIKSRDKKGVIINQILKAAKEIGFAKVLKKA